MRLKLENATEWKLVALTAPARRRGVARSADAADLPDEFLLPGVTIEQRARAQTAQAAARRGAAPQAAELSVDCAAGESALVAARHESGALTFHPPLRSESSGARRGAGRRTLHFRVAARPSPAKRRGWFGSTIKLILLKVKEAVVDAAVGAVLQTVGPALESLWWNKRGLKEGWFRVAPRGGGLQLSPVEPAAISPERSLLLLHGTFSHAAAAFAGLATASGGFFEKASAVYGDRIFAFNHFTITRSPEENCRMLLDGLPASGATFDAVTHSRGGLVLRTLVEQPDAPGLAVDRFNLGRAVLVAAPNQGTPLATPDRWQQTIGLVANLLEMFPANPWTTGAQFVAHGLVWLAESIVKNLPGLEAMDGDGPTIAALQQPGRLPADGYATLAANYSPDDAIWRRLLDAGIDSFFAGANDLVVPSEGSWLIDAAADSPPAAASIGCFGPGGNLRNDGTVHHLNFFEQPETVRFLLQSLIGPPQSLPPIDAGRPLPSRAFVRRGAAPDYSARAAQASFGPSHRAPETPSEPSPAQHERISPRSEAPPTESGLYSRGTADNDVLQLLILGEPGDDKKKQILAMYRSARVVEEFATQNDESSPSASRRRNAQPGPGTRFHEIIRVHKRIRNCLEGEGDELPDEEDMLAFGENLFETLFTGRVRRLYDVARSEQRDGPLNVIFTSTVPWLASIPWEFAFDPSRRKFLVTEEVHFIRNVLTAVPAQHFDGKRRRLRILVVAAQPLGTVELSLQEEEERIRHSFDPLVKAGLVELDVLTDATPARFHGKIQGRELERLNHGSGFPAPDDRRYDVVHFIGHGEFDRQANQGKLLFQTKAGGKQEVDLRTLREILCGRGIQLVFLNACDTAHDDKSMLNRGIAQALIEAGLPAVVANQYPVLDDSAVGFADHFYWSLAQGASLGEAAREARIALNYAIRRDSIDWAVPVLFARDPTYRICVRTQPTVGMPPAAESVAAPSGRASSAPASAATIAAPKVLRVGVADLPRFFTGLDDVLSRLNDVQDRIVFESVEVVPPLGAWEVKKDDGRSHSYLHAERFARLLKGKPRELGVDFLACVTNRRMRDNDDYDIYGWWSGLAELPILLFSTSGLALVSRGSAAGRTITNQLVGSLAAQLLESETNRSCIHARGDKKCPFYYNKDVDLDLVEGRLQFEKRCRDKMLKSLPKSLDPAGLVPAFDKLLAAFDEYDADEEA